MLFRKIAPLLMALLLSVSMLAILPVSAQTPVIKCYSDVTELGHPVTMPDVRGTTFKVAVVVEDVLGLYGFDVQFNWTTQWIRYTSYKVYVPVETYPSPIPPSPYAGILHESTMKLKEVVNETHAIPLAEPGTMAWIGYSSMDPAPSFDGSGTIVVFTFNVVDQPFDYEEPAGVTIKVHFIATSLSDKPGTPIPHTAVDLEIPLYPRAFEYPAVPMLKVTPSSVSGYSLGEAFTMSVWLLGADGGDLDALWDVAGCDFYLNFDPTMLKGLGITIDPDGSFGAFWSEGTFELAKETDNTEGWMHVAFMGFGATHTPVYGTLRIATVTFHVIYESPVYPPPTTPITLENPLVPSTWYIMDADGGIINLSVPVGTDWTGVFPNTVYPIGFNITDWSDEDLDGELSVGDQVIMLNQATMKWYDYLVDDVTGTLGLQMLIPHDNQVLWAMDSPYGCVNTGTMYNGYGIANWTGNFSLPFPVLSVNYFEVHPQIGAPYNLTENVDFRINPDGTIELLTGLDEAVINEYMGNMSMVHDEGMEGWPGLGGVDNWYSMVASSIQSVWLDFNNGTTRYASNAGYMSATGDYEGPMPAGAEWWYDPDWPSELESWWATGFAPYPAGPFDWMWPDATDIYVNYTAPAQIEVDYLGVPDPLPYFMEWTGDYADFVALTDPFNTTWHQIYPSYSKTGNATAWIDNDNSTDLTIGDTVTMDLAGTIRDFNVTGISTDIKVIQYPCVQDIDTTAPFYCHRRIVEIAGFPHPERTMSPWFERDYGIPLPHAVQDAAYQAPFAPPGRWIDVYTQYPAPYGGQGFKGPSDAFGPQATVQLYAEVTYNLNPVQNKPVTFQIEHGEWSFTFCNVTDASGIAWVKFGLPWPCDDPEGRVFGTWSVIALVEIREIVVIDTLTFEVGWLIDIVSVVPSQSSYAIGEQMKFTVTYTSISHQPRTAYFTIVVTDDLDVPIGWLTIGPVTVSYGTDTIVLECMKVPKHTFVGEGKVWTNILTDLPKHGGAQYCPEERISIGLTIS